MNNFCGRAGAGDLGWGLFDANNARIFGVLGVGEWISIQRLWQELYSTEKVPSIGVFSLLNSFKLHRPTDPFPTESRTRSGCTKIESQYKLDTLENHRDVR